MIDKVTSADLKKKQVVYYARVVPNMIYDVCELIVRTIDKDWFVGSDKRDKHAYLMPYSDFGKDVFFIRNEALKVVKEAEKNRKVFYTKTKSSNEYE